MAEIETTTSRMWQSDDGIFITRMKKNSYETLDLAKENGAAQLKLKGDGPSLPILVDFSLASGQDQKTRQYYAENSGQWCTKAALLVHSPVSRVMGNIYMGLNKPKIPTRLFTNEEEAMAWLKKKS